MKTETAAAAAALLHRQRVAALGTLHEGAPAVSMVPYSIHGDPFALVILVSSLSAHTHDMRAQPRVGVLVTETEREGAPAHALARVSVEALARAVPANDPMHAAAHASYVARFPDMAMLFELGDFALFALEPRAVRVVLGFAQAHSITPETLARAVAATAG
jgi:hypothetical protein